MTSSALRLLRRASLAGLLLGCAEADGPDGELAGPHVVRLLDPAAAPRIERGFDPLDPAALLEHGTETLSLVDLGAGLGDPYIVPRDVVRHLGELPPEEPGPRVVEGGAGPRLAVRPGEGVVTIIDAVPDVPLVVELQADGATDQALFLVPLVERPTPARVRDLTWLQNRFVHHSLSMLPAGEGLQRAVLPTQADTRAVMVMGLALQGPLVLGRLRLLRPNAAAEALLAGGATPDGRGLSLADEAREAICLPAPGRIEWDVRVPDRDPRLLLELGRLGPRPLVVHATATLAASPEASRPELAHTWIVPVNQEGWQRIDEDLGPLAGRDVRLSLTLTQSGEVTPGDPSVVVLGTPRLVGLPARPDPRPDVIVVSLDTLRADRLEPGSAATPHLQQLAGESVWFRDATSTSSWTLPAHASLFTSRWPPSHGATQQRRQLSAPAGQLLAATFREAGYSTAAVTGGGFVAPSFGLSSGFEEYGHLDPMQPMLREDGPVRDAPSRGRPAELLSAPRRQPLFLFLHTYAAHSWAPLPAEIDALGGDGESGLELRDRAMARDPRLAESAVQLTPEEEAQLARELHLLYDASASAADALVGELIDTLKRTGRWEHTVLVVLSDHGQEILERGLVGHGHSLHAELVRVPLLLRGPGLTPAEIDTPVSLVDVAPTLRELVGLPADPGAEGLSLVPLLEGRRLPERPRFAHVEGRDSSLHRVDRGPLSLLASEWLDEVSPTTLHDVQADPAERRDLSDAHPDRVAPLLDELQRHLTRTRASATERVDAAVDAATRRRLLELGYTGDQ